LALAVSAALGRRPSKHVLFPRFVANVAVVAGPGVKRKNAREPEALATLATLATKDTFSIRMGCFDQIWKHYVFDAR